MVGVGERVPYSLVMLKRGNVLAVVEQGMDPGIWIPGSVALRM